MTTVNGPDASARAVLPEINGAHPPALADDDSWIYELGHVMVTLALTNDTPGEVGWPTRLVVFEQGRKVDFTLAG